MRKKIFISYRRTDTSTASGRIYDRLVARYGKDNVFKDIDSIPAGVDFPAYITDTIAQCAVMLVVIGRTWLAADQASGSPRLHAPDDLVRREIEAALAHQVTLIPVLVEGAEMPSAHDLPESIRALVNLNGDSLPADPYFEDGIRRLARRAEGQLPPGMRPQVRARRRALTLGSALALVLAAVLVIAIVQPPPFGVPERLPAHWGSQALTAAVVTGPAEGWVVGTGGLLLQVAAQRATRIETPVTDDLYAAASGPHDAWAVGAHGAVLHWDGQSWTAPPRPTTADLYGVAETSNGQVWAVGAAGTILHRSGGAWQQVASPTRHALAPCGVSAPQRVPAYPQSGGRLVDNSTRKGGLLSHVRQ